MIFTVDHGQRRERRVYLHLGHNFSECRQEVDVVCEAHDDGGTVDRSCMRFMMEVLRLHDGLLVMDQYDAVKKATILLTCSVPESGRSSEAR